MRLIVRSGTSGQRATRCSPISRRFSADAHREWLIFLQNETGDPYGAAHNATANLDDRYLQQDMVDAIANLATSTASDHEAIAQLTATVARLTTDLATVNKKLVVSLQAKRAIRGSRGGRNKATRGRGDGARARAATKSGSGDSILVEMAGGADLDLTIHYCWTCGPGCRHNSDK